VTRRCDCHDLLAEDCDALRDAVTRQRAEALAELERLARLIALPRIIPAQYGGICAACGERFLQGSPLRRLNNRPDAPVRWVADCCLDDNGRITTA
jgi:hypothetical protein